MHTCHNDTYILITGSSSVLNEDSTLLLTPIFLDNVQCNGEERRLLDCPHSGINEHQCGSYAVAKIVCQAEGTGLIA